MSYLRDNAPKILEFVEKNKTFIAYNAKIQRVREGDMLGVMREEFDSIFEVEQNKYDYKRFCVAYNYLEHIIDKRSQVFTFDPQFIASSEQETVDYYVDKFGLMEVFQKGNEYANASKSVLFRMIKKKNGDPGFKAIDNSLFMVYSDDEIEPDRPTCYILIMYDFMKKNPKTNQMESCTKLHLYTDDEFLAIDSDGEIDEEKTKAEGNGVNGFGEAPFIYVNYTANKLLPTVNKDILQNNIIINTYYTEGKVANHYMSNPVRYGTGIDKSLSNINFSAYKFMILNPPEGSEITPEIHEMAVTLSHAESIAMIEKMESTLATLAKVNLSGFNGDAGKSTASGDALVMLGQDILEDRKKQITYFKPRIEEFMNKLARWHNYLLDTLPELGPTMPAERFADDFSCEVIFPTPDTAKQQMEGDEVIDEEAPEEMDVNDESLGEEDPEDSKVENPEAVAEVPAKKVPAKPAPKK